MELTNKPTTHRPQAVPGEKDAHHAPDSNLPRLLPTTPDALPVRDCKRNGAHKPAFETRQDYVSMSHNLTDDASFQFAGFYPAPRKKLERWIARQDQCRECPPEIASQILEESQERARKYITGIATK